MRAVCIVLLSFLLPAVASGANFGKQSIFLSSNSPTAGETVFIHVVVSNDANTKFSGTLELLQEDDPIGSVAVALDAQKAEAVSIQWKPEAGRHTIKAELKEADGTVVEKDSATFAVAERDSDSEQSTEVASSAKIQAQLSNFSPGFAEASAPVFGALDLLRKSAAGALDKGTDWAQKTSGTKQGGSVLGTSTSENAEKESGIVAGGMRIAGTALLYIFSFLSYLIKNPALFYPIFAVGMIYGLWRLYKRMRQPRYE